jgi:hypothetical protein
MQTQQAIEPTVIDPETVAAFYKRRPGTEDLVRQAVGWVREEFSEIESITLQADRDPEEDAEWIRITVTTRQKADDLNASYRRYLKRDVAEAPRDLWHFVSLLRYGV